jgi:hypothetical protein
MDIAGREAIHKIGNYLAHFFLFYHVFWIGDSTAHRAKVEAIKESDLDPGSSRYGL